ncbi:MAG: two-component sensor histidine kinase [Desulfobulbaceae bacterium A2]|nr:MAG: two-component sensor histidine kinase [Desulfobulbaceae bacterium A2]
MVKYFFYTSLTVILVSSLLLSWIISENARKVMLNRSESYAQLAAQNLNHQVFLQFVLPTAIRFGRIALRQPEQFERLDTLVRNLVQGLPIDSVTIYDSSENVISYSTVEEMVGRREVGGLEYRKALEGDKASILISNGSLLNLLPGGAPFYCKLKTSIPFRQEQGTGERSGLIMGVIEIVQDLSEDLEAIIRLQERIILLSLFVMGVLFGVLSVIVIRADRIMAARSRERLRLEEKLHESERLATLGKMVAAVSHEIKNPLGIVRSTAEVLGKRIKNVAPGNEHLAAIIVDETTRLDKIVREFLNFARPQEPRREAAQLEDIVERLAQFIAPELARHQVQLHRTDFRPLPPVQVDRDQIYRALLNIVLNALQAMPEGGDLCLETRPERGGVVVVVRDNGCGMDEEKCRLIFTPFYTDKHRGTGLGLAITRNIIEAHGGSIGVESRPDSGSTFTVFLPAGA